MSAVKYDYKKLTTNIDNFLYISWEVTTFCNYSCSYCWPESHDNVNKWPTDFNKIVIFFNKLRKAYENKKIFIEIMGGEPTLWPDLKNFIRFFNNNFFINLVTNFTKNKRYWEDFPRVCLFSLSFHPERASVDNFLEKLDILCKKQENIAISFMYLPQYKEKNFEMIKKIKEKNYKVFFVSKIIKNYETGMHLESYTKEDFDNIKRNNFYNSNNLNLIFPSKFVLDGKEQNINFWKEIQEKKQNSWVGWKCYIGSKRLFIKANGDIYKATCRVGGKIGNIYDENFFKLEKEYEICTKKICECKVDAFIEKEFVE
ncbi:MAG: hypothetical protein NZZ41_00485 [Candidatus Dojkabacteria bacterium]|nr:hypothetical protein [Candidatus Dojkabacteria bacterium]